MLPQGFMDREAGKKDLFCYKSDAECKGTAKSDPYLSQALVTKDLTVANLDQVTFTSSDATIKTNMMKGVTDTTFKHDWYYWPAGGDCLSQLSALRHQDQTH